MLFISILMPFILGALLIRLVHPKSSVTETVGLSFLAGIFLETVFMIALDACSLPIARLPLLLLNIVFIGLLFFLLWRRGSLLFNRGCLFGNFLTSLKSLNAVWLLLIVFIAWFEYLNLEKCLFFPTFDRDSLTSFDTIGYVLAQEHTYKGLSIFNSGYYPGIMQAGSSIGYTPLVQLSYGYVYLFGAETSKLIPALVYLSFIITFYALTTRCVKKTGAALITFLMMLTPQMFAFSSLSMTNVIHAAYASLGTLYGFFWLKSKQRDDLILSAVLLAANVWARYEGILFILVLGIPIIVSMSKDKTVKLFLTWVLIATAPFIFWLIFQQITGIHNEKGFVRLGLFWDVEKMDIITRSLFNQLLNTENYGWTFFAVPLSFIINLRYVIGKRDNLAMLLVLVGDLLLYGIILYQIDYTWDSIQNVLAFSAKRFLFCFVPIAWFYASTNQSVCRILIYADNWLAFNKKDHSLPT